MSQTGLQRLETLRKLNSNRSWLNEDIYRLFYKKDLHLAAYNKVQSRYPGENRDVDYSHLIEKTIGQIKDCSFQFTKGSRKNKTACSPLERQTAQYPLREKVVQEIIRLILEAIYDGPENPYFHDFCHGFRKGRGRHSALRAMRSWQGTSWFIEGPIKGCFGAMDHHKLIEFMTQKITDDRFLDLIWKALKSGCLDAEKETDPLFGTPQGCIISPVLANIYLHQLDCFIIKLAQEYNAELYNKNQLDQINPCTRTGYPRRKCRTPELATTGHTSPIKLGYSRYADDWLIGLAGPKGFAVEIDDKVQNFLADKLKLVPRSTPPQIKHAKSEKALFLETLVYSQNSAHAPNSSLSSGGEVRLEAPIGKIIHHLHRAGFCDGSGRPMPKKDWLFRSLEEIITTANAHLKGYRDFYIFADNFSGLRRIEYIIQYSCAKTISAKMKLGSLRKTFKKYTTSLSVCREKSTEKVQLDLTRFAKRIGNGIATGPRDVPMNELSNLQSVRNKKSPPPKSPEK